MRASTLFACIRNLRDMEGMPRWYLIMVATRMLGSDAAAVALVEEIRHA